MRNYFRYLGYIWHYRARVIISVVSSLLSESLNVGSIVFYLAVHDILLNLYFSGGKNAGPMASDHFFKTALGRRVIDFLRTRVVTETLLMWTIISFGLALLGVVAVRGIFIFLRRYLLESAAQRGWIDLLNDLFQRVSSLSMRYFSQRSLGHAMSTFGPDLTELGTGGRSIFSHAVRDTFRFLLGLATCFWISVRLSLTVFVAVPIAIYVFKVVGDRVRRYTSKGLEKRADAMKILAETIQGISVIKAYDAEQYQRERFRETSQRMLRYDLRRALVKALADPVTEMVWRACLWVVGAYGVYLVIRWSFPMSMLGAFFFAVKQVYDPVEKLRDLNNEIQAGRAAADRVFAVLDLEPEIREKPNARALPLHSSEVRFDHVSFAYELPDDPDPLALDRACVIRDFDLTIRAGEIVAIVGENGSGKSTLASLLLRFYDPSRGTVSIDAVDLRDVTQSSLRRQIGYAAQSVILFNDTVRRNIAFADPRYSDAEIEAAARAAQAHDFIVGDLPKGYDTVIGEGGAKLSGGQRQRLSLARALLRNPRILILDEATSAMDAEAEHRLEAQLDAFARGHTVILIAHRFSALRFAHRIVVLDRGRIERMGTHDELLPASPIYRNLFLKQQLAPGGSTAT